MELYWAHADMSRRNGVVYHINKHNEDIDIN